jgi:hypothetical protein
MITGLAHSHNGLAYLLVSSTSISLLLAFVTAATGAKPGLIRFATVLVRVEAALMGVIGLLGIAAWFMRPWPVGSPWAWIGVVALVVQGGLVAKGVKPAIAAAGEGAGAGRWVGMAAAHWALILFVFGTMQMQLGQ